MNVDFHIHRSPATIWIVSNFSSQIALHPPLLQTDRESFVNCSVNLIWWSMVNTVMNESLFSFDERLTITSLLFFILLFLKTFALGVWVSPPPRSLEGISSLKMLRWKWQNMACNFHALPFSCIHFHALPSLPQSPSSASSYKFGLRCFLEKYVILLRVRQD